MSIEDRNPELTIGNPSVPQQLSYVERVQSVRQHLVSARYDVAFGMSQEVADRCFHKPANSGACATVM